MSTMHPLRDKLPAFLLDTLETGVISESEAIDLWTVFALPDDSKIVLPQALMAAMDRIRLWHMPASPMHH